ASFAAGAVRAEIMYDDEFDGDDFNWDFWDGIGKFVVENGKMSGWEDAKIGQSRYKWEEGKSGITTTSEWPCQKEFTEWIDINVDEGGIGDSYAAGFWIPDGGDADRGWAADRVIYSVLYYAQDGPENGPYEYSFVQMSSDSQMKDKRKEKPWGDHVYGRLYLPEYINYAVDGETPVSGFNLEGDPVRIGVRFGKGNITAYANGKIVGSFDYETIGTLYTPLLVQNWNNYVEFDNYCLATYDHNVKKATRLDSYELYEGKVTVVDTEGNVLGEIDAAEDDAVTIDAPTVSGKTFTKWDSVSVNGEKVTDFEKTALLYGISLGDLTDEAAAKAAAYSLTMPDCDVVVTAAFGTGSSDTYKVTVDGEVLKEGVSAVTSVTVSATADEGSTFKCWTVVSGDIGSVDLTSATLTFTMPASDVELQATYIPSNIIPGDANGDGKLNSRDVILVMKAALPGFNGNIVMEAADLNGDGKINSRDVIAVMKAVLAAA
ncbi:MAG: hypothetical protein IJT56_04660, partial [Clostridia bacterium]|nr:hypothetical protein [Clostridia bacterium]